MKDAAFWLILALNIFGVGVSVWNYFHDTGGGTIACNHDGTVNVTNVNIVGIKFRDNGELADRYATVCRFSRS